MAAYVYNHEGFKLEIFRVNKPRGRWLLVGEHKDVPGFAVVTYRDELPAGCSPMSKEGAPYRQMAAEDLLNGIAPEFSKYWKE